MAKLYEVPKLSQELLLRIAKLGYKLERKSKDCIKLIPIDDYMPQYKRYYSFHIDFNAGEVSGMNINEYTSNYKRATIWIKSEELKLLLDIEKELKNLLETAEFLA